MNNPVFYNENDPFTAQWLRNLVNGSKLPPGKVSDQDIRDIRPEDLVSFGTCHFFAGIGGWPYAMRLAGIPDSLPFTVWTGSCPCQPFSRVAGKRKKGFDDERHLWPVWFRLIGECRPSVIFGEQVASPAGRQWLTAVSADLGKAGYAVGAADLCAAGVGAPHIRQRLFFGAVRRRGGVLANPPGRERGVGQCEEGTAEQVPSGRCCDAVGYGGRVLSPFVAHSDRYGGGRNPGAVSGKEKEGSRGREETGSISDSIGLDSATGKFWYGAEWVPCRDGKERPVKPGVRVLVNGFPTRVGRIRAYGNAIVPQVAAVFIRAFLDSVSGIG